MVRQYKSSEKDRAYARGYYIEHRETYLKYAKEYHKSHPGHLSGWNHRTGRQRPLAEAKDTGVYLGIIAENALSRFFDNITHMPYGNPGYDFLCGRGFKIDVKSSCIQNYLKYRRWNFHIFRNHIANYFLCVGFDNRKNLNPQHIWLIPAEQIWDKVSIKIYDSERNLNKWGRFEKPLGKMIECCSLMREKGVV